MKRPLIYLVLTFLILRFLPVPALATYSLPYPSYMPGSKFYAISRFLDRAREWWSWGSIARLKYNLALADKYLVEAKTLFEYKQYLLAVNALERSNYRVRLLPLFLQTAKDEGKDIKKLQSVIEEAMGVHIVVLDDLSQRLPGSFIWQPEKSAPTILSLGQALDTSKQERNSVANFHVQ